MGQRSCAPKKTHVPDDIQFLTKPQIALKLIDEALADGIQVKAWTFDELYGRDGYFLDELDARHQAFVGEIPANFRMWTDKPRVLRKPPQNGSGPSRRYPRLSAANAIGYEVKNLARYSHYLRDQNPQRYKIHDSHKGPEVWDIRWRVGYRKTHDAKLVSSRCTLIVARNIRTDETKFFISNRMPDVAGWTIRELLRVAFGRWRVEACFREAKEELGWDHFECRGWDCIHRHLIVTIVAQLFCARVREKLCQSEVVTDAQRLTLEQVRRATDVYIATIDLPPRIRKKKYQEELQKQRYHQQRNATASRSHHKKRRAYYLHRGIDPDRIKSVYPKKP